MWCPGFARLVGGCKQGSQNGCVGLTLPLPIKMRKVLGSKLKIPQWMVDRPFHKKYPHGRIDMCKGIKLACAEI